MGIPRLGTFGGRSHQPRSVESAPTNQAEYDSKLEPAISRGWRPQDKINRDASSSVHLTEPPSSRGSSSQRELSSATSPPAMTLEDSSPESGERSETSSIDQEHERRVRLKIDLRLCTIAGVLCALNLADSSIISSASVTSIFEDLQLGVGNRYSISIFIFTIASVTFQLPATLAVRLLGPRIFFACVTFTFGLLTLCTAFVQSWRQMIALRVLLGICTSGIYPGLTVLISTWYTRREQQLRFAFLQVGEVVVLATSGIVNYGLNHLDGYRGLRGWQWMFLVQGLITCILGLATYWWMVDFPESAHKSFRFLSDKDQRLAMARIQDDRGDVELSPFNLKVVLKQYADPKIYGFAIMFFLQNLVSTALAYFLPIILQGGMGYDTDQSILLSQPPYYWAVIPVVLSSWIGDRYRLRGPVIIFNSVCLICGFCMFGFSNNVAVRYVGVFLATGAYVSNWAALNSYQANNITGQWKRAATAAAVTAMNGLGGVAGSFIVVQTEAPRYVTAIWVSIGSHIVMITFVLLFSGFFYVANRQQKRGRKIIEATEGFRYTF